MKAKKMAKRRSMKERAMAKSWRSIKYQQPVALRRK
jgi:hypothetical protein